MAQATFPSALKADGPVPCLGSDTHREGTAAASARGAEPEGAGGKVAPAPLRSSAARRSRPLGEAGRSKGRGHSQAGGRSQEERRAFEERPLYPADSSALEEKGGREGGRSCSKMAAQRRSLLQSVSGTFPPSVHTHPLRWVRGGTRAASSSSSSSVRPSVPRSAVWEGGGPARAGIFPPSVGRGVVALPPSVPPEGRGGPSLRGGGHRSPLRAGLQRCGTGGGRQVAGGGCACVASGAQLCEGAAGVCRPCVCVYWQCAPGRWRPRGCLSNCWQQQGPSPLVLGERTLVGDRSLPCTPAPRMREGLIHQMNS